MVVGFALGIVGALGQSKAQKLENADRDSPFKDWSRE